MTTITIEEGKLYLEFSKGLGSSVGTYTPYVWTKAKTVRNPSTGQMMDVEAKWMKVDLYFTNLVHALRWCAQELVHVEDPSNISLDSYISRCEAVWKQ